MYVIVVLFPEVFLRNIKKRADYHHACYGVNERAFRISAVVHQYCRKANCLDGLSDIYNN
jgi:hypothetical protein